MGNHSMIGISSRTLRKEDGEDFLSFISDSKICILCAYITYIHVESHRSYNDMYIITISIETLC